MKLSKFLHLCRMLLITLSLFLPTALASAQTTAPSSNTNSEEIRTTQSNNSTTSSKVATPAPTLPPPPSGMNLTLSPIYLPIETTPSQSVTTEIKVRNNSTDTEYLHIDMAKFRPDETGEKPILLDLEPEDEFAQWISFDQQQFAVQPGEWKTLKVTFSPPESASLNYYYVLVFNRQNLIQTQDETVLSGAPAMLVLANVLSPNTKRELQLTSFKVPKVFFEFLPVTFEAVVKNTGNTYLAPSGNIFIDGNGKKDIAILPFNQHAANVLPNTQRLLTIAWEDGFPVYKPQMEKERVVTNEQGLPKYKLEWNFSEADKFRIGKYTANLLMVYDNGERDVLIESQQSFWVVPWRIMAAMTVVAIFALFGLWNMIAPIFRNIRRKPTSHS